MVQAMKIRDSTVPLLAEYARSGRVVVFDTETTGGRPYDEICQIAAVEYVNGTMTRTLALYICPTCEMNPWAEMVHGLSLDFLHEHGLAPEDAMLRFFEFVGDNALLVAHNAQFDLRMVRQECRKFDLSFAPENVETCDTLLPARECSSRSWAFRSWHGCRGMVQCARNLWPRSRPQRTGKDKTRKKMMTNEAIVTRSVLPRRAWN